MWSSDGLSGSKLGAGRCCMCRPRNSPPDRQQPWVAVLVNYKLAAPQEFPSTGWGEPPEPPLHGDHPQSQPQSPRKSCGDWPGIKRCLSISAYLQPPPRTLKGPLGTLGGCGPVNKQDPMGGGLPATDTPHPHPLLGLLAEVPR